MVANRKHLGIGLAVVVVAAALVVAGMSRGGSGSGAGAPVEAESTGTAHSTGIDLARHNKDDPMAIGDPDAPVVMVEYADFRCPFCGVFARDIKPKLMHYVKDGELRIEYHDLPVFGQQSLRAAVAGRAAAKQDHFWDFFEAVFAAAPERGHPDLPRKKLIAFAKKAGVPDIEQFTKDLDSDKLLRKVRADAQKAIDIGATGTPFFMVNDEPIMGAQPVPVFEKTIERQARQ